MFDTIVVGYVHVRNQSIDSNFHRRTGCRRLWGATDAQPSVRTTVTIAVDSVWQVPSGFSVVLPLTNEGVGEMLRNDPGAPPDLPEFSMSGEVQADGEPERVVIAV